MQMIDVLKRLAELDAGNPNVENKMGSVESLITVSNVDGEVAKINESVDSVEECGSAMGPSMAPRTPASINMTASSGEELAGMLRDIMSLAGVSKDHSDSHKDVEVLPGRTLEPDNDMMSTIKMIDSMNEPGEEEMELEVDPDDQPHEEGMDDRVYVNSPEEEIEAHDYGDKQVDPKPQGLKHRFGDNPYKPARESIDALADRLLNEFHEFISEGKKAKPDFLDMDKDGNKKEPMKKALKDKKSKKKVDESEVEISELTKGAKWRYTDAARKSADDLAKKASSASSREDSKKYVDKAVKRFRNAEKVEKNLVGEETKPSTGLSAKKKSDVVKKAKAGKDIGKKGKGFKDVAASAAKKYGSKEKGEKVAAAAMWKNVKR